jgi:hypothetical protein
MRPTFASHNAWQAEMSYNIIACVLHPMASHAFLNHNPMTNPATTERNESNNTLDLIYNMPAPSRKSDGEDATNHRFDMLGKIL